MAYLFSLSEAARTPCPIVIEEAAGSMDYPPPDAQTLARLHRDNTPLLNLPRMTADLEEMEAYAARIRRQSDRLVLVGIGGSCLGARALAAAADSRDPMKFHIMDNPDPASVDMLLAACDPQRTSWLFVSKSGGTLETLSQVLVILGWLEERIGSDHIRRRCLAIAGPKASPLSALAAQYHIPVLKHADFGGRWACFSNIGLLPAACCGVDIRRCREGAYTMVRHALTADIAGNRPLQGALFAAAQYRASRTVHVVMPYGDRADFVPWYCQLASESLGKNGKGMTPLSVRGAVDQHSMLQLMLGGPDDKFFTLIALDHAGKGKRIPAPLAQVCGLGYLAGHAVGDVLAAFQEGTLGSIRASGRPVRVMRLPQFDAYHLGALLMYFMLETLYLAELFLVDPFDQPAVEDSKTRAKLILKNTGVPTLREMRG